MIIGIGDKYYSDSSNEEETSDEEDLWSNEADGTENDGFQDMGVYCVEESSMVKSREMRNRIGLIWLIFMMLFNLVTGMAKKLSQHGCLVVIMILLLQASAVYGVIQSTEGVYCGKENHLPSVLKINLSPLNCSDPFGKQNYTTAQAQIFQPNAFKSNATGLKSCKIKVVSVHSYYGLFGSQTSWKEAKYEPMSRTECIDMIQTGRCRYGSFKYAYGIIQTVNSEAPEYTYASRHTKAVSQCVLSVSTIYNRHDQKQPYSIITDASECIYSTGFCTTDTETLVWTPNAEQKCEFLPWEEVTGIL